MRFCLNQTIHHKRNDADLPRKRAKNARCGCSDRFWGFHAFAVGGGWITAPDRYPESMPPGDSRAPGGMLSGPELRADTAPALTPKAWSPQKELPRPATPCRLRL